MTARKRNIKVDEATAVTAIHGAAIGSPRDEIAEFDCRWMAVKSGEATVPHEKVVRWLQTCGTPSYTPWNDQ